MDMVKKLIIIISCLLLVIGLCIFNAKVINIKQIKVRQEIIKSEKINDNLNDFLIAYFSDLHYGTFINQEFVNEVINTINNYDVDIVIFGGDLFDSPNISLEDKTFFIQQLKSIKANYGKYAVLGECDTNDITTTQILKDADFTILNNSNISISVDKKSSINIIGISDVNDMNAFSGVDSNNYTFVISHFPDCYDNVKDYNFDYMLAGHSHGGQVYLPIINLFTRDKGCEKYFHGKYKEDNKILDITNGLGRSKYNARFLADSEIVMYRLNSK